ncbi:MAG: leucine-rich repeat domain-containing protein, partial [Muribaculaceae bacterium]|nr:leucine-rich repeat domain-containing protein [Muribaculaceae bacterium]
MKKRLLLLLFAVLSLLPLYAYSFKIDGIYYNINSGTSTCSVTYRDSYKYSGEVVIPASVIYNGAEYSVTSIGNAAFNGCIGLTSVAIPNSVTSIGNYAFNGCIGLTTVKIGNSVTTIGDHAFSGCIGLTSVDIPNSVTTISECAFVGCSSLTSVDISNSVTIIGQEAFEDCIGLTSVVIPNSVTSIGNYVFKGCSSLASVIIGNSVTIIGKHAFEDCVGLTSVEIGNSVTSIGDNAFKGCIGLTLVSIPNSVTSIGSGAFYGCIGLTTVAIPNSVTLINYEAFNGCSSLTLVSIPNSVSLIDSKAFNGCTSLTTLIVEDGDAPLQMGYNEYNYSKYGLVEGKGLFYDCPLETLYLGRTLSYETGQSYGFSPFYGKESLKEVTISNSVTSIEERLFYNCSTLTSVEIPNSVTSIGNAVFCGCTALTNIIIKDGESTLSLGYNDHVIINSAGCGLFYDCPLETLYLGRTLSYETGQSYGFSPFYGKESLKEVTIGNLVTKIGDYAFYGCSGLNGSLTIPNSMESIGNYSFNGCEAITSLIIEDGETTLDLGYNNYHKNSYDGAGKGLFSSCPLETLYLGRNLRYNADENYGYSPFYEKRSLKEVTIGNLVTKIGDYAFSGCSGLTGSLTIPNSVTSIGNAAFNGCKAITNLMIEDGGTTLSLGYNDTGKGLFYDCPLETLHLGRNLSYETGKDYGYSPFYGKSSLKELTIGNTVTSIGERAFNGCSGLTSVEIPTSVTSIGQYVFDGCSGLTSVEFSNSVTSIGGSAFNGCSGLKEVHISDIEAWCKIDFGSKTSNPLFYAHRLFINGNEVKEITIPNSVTSIGNYAFYGCDNIYQILSEAVTPPEISDDSFSAEVYDNALVTIPSGTLKSYQSKWSLFKHLLEGEPVERSYEITQAGTLMNKLNLSEVNNIISLKLSGPLNGTDLLTLNKMPNIQTLDLSEATIVSGGMNYYEEDNVKYGTQDNTLGNFWAYALDCLTEVKLPKNLVTLGAGTFQSKTFLNGVIIPASVISIGNYAFSGCSSLTNLIIEDGATTLSLGYNDTGKGLFYDCPLETLYLGRDLIYNTSPFYGKESLRQVTLANSVTTIGANAFSYSGLSSVEIPSSVTTIASDAFQNCSGLKEVHIS